MKNLILLALLLVASQGHSQIKAIQIDGSIKVFYKIPTHWGQTTNFQKVSEARLYSEGFRDIVAPILTEYQRKGVIYFDAANDYFTYTVIDFTDQEIADYDQRQLDNDTVAIALNKRIEDAKQIKIRYFAHIRRITADKDQAATVREFFFDAMLPLNDGDFELTQKRLDLLTTQNTTLNNLLTKIKNQIDDYLSDE